MPIIKSAIKRMRQESVRRDRNRLVKDELRAATKAFSRAVEAGDAKLAAEALRDAQSQLSKAVKKHLLHKNTAARKLAQLNAMAKALGAKPTSIKKTPAKKPAAKAPAAKKPAPKPKKA